MATGKSLYRNTLSYFGGLVVLGSALLMLGFFLLEFVMDHASPYLGIITYLLLPMGIGFGGLLFLYGMRRESLRRRRAGSTEAQPFPKLDLNEPRQRRKFVFALFAGGFLLIVMAFAAYKGFHYTESVSFCGQVCHTVMEPEHTLYQQSAHARVPCVACHVGEGVDSYLKSKLSGVRQVIAVLRNSYKRPIPVPIHGLRPARETCEKCHWPAKFFGAKYQQIPHFRYTEGNDAEQINLHVKTGGGQPVTGDHSGIHWHMAISNEVRYTALDPGLQHIATVRVKRADGTTDEYQSRDVKLPAGGGQPERLMDCMDCHNRPSHRVMPPEEAVNKALASQKLDRTLPHIKLASVDALVAEVAEDASPHAVMLERLQAFYKKRYPDALTLRAADIAKAAQVLGDIHKRNVFPKMKMGFGTYPSNIGHRSWPGCFRCHDERHVSPTTGKVLSMDCALCHTAPERSAVTAMGTPPTKRSADWHPYRLAGEHAKLQCHKCHAAGANPAQTCEGCHKIKTDKLAPMMDILSCGDCHFQNEPGAKATCSSARCHVKLGGLHEEAGHGVDCVRCHTPHTFKASGEAACRSCHGGAKLERQGPWK